MIREKFGPGPYKSLLENIEPMLIWVYVGSFSKEIFPPVIYHCYAAYEEDCQGNQINTRFVNIKRD